MLMEFVISVPSLRPLRGHTATCHGSGGTGRRFSSTFESPRKLSDQLGDWQATKKPAGTAKAGFGPL